MLNSVQILWTAVTTSTMNATLSEMQIAATATFVLLLFCHRNASLVSQIFMFTSLKLVLIEVFSSHGSGNVSFGLLACDAVSLKCVYDFLRISLC